MPLQGDPEVSQRQYADNVEGLTTVDKLENAEKNLSSFLKKIENWCRTWRVALSPEKSKVVVFSRCPRHKKESLDLYHFGVKLKVYEEADLLGVTFDQRLTWEPQ
jgi:hypothetical protein